MRSIKIRCGHGVEEVYGDLATPWRDKHGNQIYEGDTVIAHLPYDDNPKRLRAVFSYVRGFRLEDMDADDGRTACHSVANAQCWDIEIVNHKPEEFHEE